MRNTEEIEKLAEVRLNEAKLLLSQNYCEGVLYLAGYCVELLLKARISRVLDIPNLFDESFQPKELRKPYYTHDLKYLLIFAGLKSKLNKEKAINQNLFTNWSLIEETWNEHCRYKNCGECKKADVERFIFAIEDQEIGIKQWISKQ